jgi:predicted nucleotidyltransferase
MKAIMDNLPETVDKIYVFGSSLRLDTATDSDLDIFIVGNVTNMELRTMLMAIPEGEIVDIIVETEDEFQKNLQDDWSSLYRKVYEGGYKIYEKKWPRPSYRSQSEHSSGKTRY